MNDERNAAIERTEGIVSPKTRGGRKDVFLLVLIVFLTALFLTTYTVMRLGALKRDLIDDPIDRSVSVIDLDAEEETTILSSQPSEEKSDKDVFAGMKDCYNDADGNFVIEYYDGSTFVGDPKQYVLVSVELTEEDLGIDVDAVPVDSVQASSEASLLMKNNVAYAGDNTQYFGETKCYSANSTYSSSTWEATNSCSCGSNSSASASCTLNIYLSGKLPDFLSRLGGQFSFWMTNNGSNGMGACTTSGTRGYITASCTCSAGCGGSSSASCKARGYASISHTYTNQPGVTWGGYSGWTTTRAYTVTATDSKLRVRSLVLTYQYNTSGSTTTAGGSGYDATSQPVTTGTDYGYVSVSTYTWNGSTKSESRSAYTLQLDRGAINITTTPRIVSSRGGTGEYGQNNQTSDLWMYFVVQDTPGDGVAAASGIASVELKNASVSGVTYTSGFVNSSGGAISFPCGYNTTAGQNGSAVSFWHSVPAASANGSWTLTVKDRQGHSKSASYTYQYWDGNKPTVSNVSVTAPDAQYKPGSSASASAPYWTNKSLTLSLRANDTSCSQGVYRAGIKSVVVSFKVNGVAKSFTPYNQTDYANVISKQSTSGTTRYVDLTVTKIMYDYTTWTDFKVTITDYTGNVNDISAPTTSVLGRLDTVAPHVTSFSAAAGTSSWTAGNIGINVSAIDYSAGAQGAYYGVSGGKYNNGSGLKNLYFFSDAGTSTQVMVNGTTSNMYQAKTTALDVTAVNVTSSNLTVRTDSSRSTFLGNLYVVAEDWVGNRSDGKAIPTTLTASEQTNAAYVVAPSYLKSGYGNNKVWLYSGGGSYKLTGLKRDTYTPQFEVTTVANGGGTVVANTAGVSGSSLRYVYKWEKSNSITIYVRGFSGGSGGTLYVKKGKATDTTAAEKLTAQTSASVPAYSPGAAVTGFSNVNLNATQPTSSYASSKSTTGADTLSAWKTYDVSFALTGQGTSEYTLYFKNGAGKFSSLVNLQINLDNTAPTVTLLGFLQNGSTTVTSQDGINSLLKESALLNPSMWLYPSSNSGYRMVFEVKDDESGVPTSATETRTSGVSGSGATQTTNEFTRTFAGIDGATTTSKTIGYRVQWWYSKDNDATDPDYQGAWTGFPTTVSSRKLFQVQFYSRTQHSAMNKSTGWDVAAGTYLRYKVAAADFMGNVGYYTYSTTTFSNVPLSAKSSNVRWNNTVMRYYVDPTPVQASAVTAWQVKSEDTQIGGNLVANGAAAIADTYTMSAERDLGWAKRAIIFEMTVQPNMAGYDSLARYQDLTNLYSTKTKLNVTTDIKVYDDLPTDVAASNIYPKGTRVWVVFDASASRNVQVAIAAISKAYNDGTLLANNGVFVITSDTKKQNGGDLNNLGSVNDPLIVKQDREAPVAQRFILSAETTYDKAAEKPLLAFDYGKSGPLALDTANSAAYNPAKLFAYTPSKVYVYILVHDKPGSLLGSGIASVKFGSETATKQTVTANLGVTEVYRTSNKYAYNSLGLSGESAWSVVVKDKQDNQTTVTYGLKDKNNYYAMPIYDGCNPYIRMDSTSEANYVQAGAGTTEDPAATPFPTQRTESGNPTNASSLRLKGTAIGNDNFYITLQYSVGISGLRIYVRRKAHNDLTRLDGFTYFSAGASISSAYDYTASGWGIFVGETWTAGGCYEINYEGTPTATGRQETQYQNVDLKLKSFKERLEILAVSGTGKYYIIDVGLLFVDTEAPDIHEQSTFFSVASSADTAATINYNSLQRIWTNKVGTDYTNGDVYIYYFITDGASGVDKNKVLYSGAKLDEVTVQNVPVWSVDGVATTARVLSSTKPTAKNVSGNLYFTDPAASKDYAVFSLPTANKNAEALKFTANPTIAQTTATITLYRLKAVGVTPYSITAGDLVPNKPNVSPATAALTPAIDKTAVSLDIGGRTSTTDANYTGYTGELYTNKIVSLRFDTSYGVSGFGEFAYSVYNDLPGSTGYQSTTNYTLKIPQINKVGGKITVTAYPNGSNTANVYTLGNWPTTGDGGIDLKVVTVSGTNYWQVKYGSTTNNVCTVNTSKYGSNVGNYTWRIFETRVHCLFDVAKQNRNDLYTVTAYNSIREEYALNRTRPSATKTFRVKMDVDAPVIDVTSGNIPEIAEVTSSLNAQNQTVYTVSVKGEWHAVAKALYVRITDSLSGIGKEDTMSFSATSAVERVYYGRGYSFIDPNNEELGERAAEEYNMVKDKDNMYRPYELVKNGNFYVKNGLKYMNHNEEYRVTAYDEAGNVAVLRITPQYDSTPATITAFSLTDAQGNAYLGTNVTVAWLNDISGTQKVRWTGGSVYATFTVNYGKSGYQLQYKKSVKADAVTVGSGTNALAWENLYVGSGKDLETVGSEVTNGDGTKSLTLRYEIGKGQDWLYAYYRFRVISKAQYTERYVYKSFNDSTKSRADEYGTYFSVERQAYEAADLGVANTIVTLSEQKDSDIIAIDKVVPTVGFSLARKDGLNANGTDKYVPLGARVGTTTSWEVPDDVWSKTNARMALSLSSTTGFASGNVIYYRSMTDGSSWSNWTMINPINGNVYQQNEQGKWVSKGTMSSDILTRTIDKKQVDVTTETKLKISDCLKAVTYTLNDSQNNVLYEFYTENGAGNVSEVVHFGTRVADKRYGIKVDTSVSELTPNGSSTLTKYTTASVASIVGNATTQARLKQEYSATAASSGYVVSADATFTYKNTVVINVQISKVGYSGIYLYVTTGTGDKVLVDTITYDKFVQEKGNGSTISRYYYVNTNGTTIQHLDATSIAGNSAETKDVYVKIDNTTPVMYVKSIAGTHASNWGWATNLYNANPEYWYVSELKVTMGIGVVENGAFVSRNPYSGYTMEYTTDKNPSASSVWIPIYNDLLTIEGLTEPVIAEQYSFRVTSGAGLKYYLGKDVLNNASLEESERAVVYSADGSDTSVKSGATLNSEIYARSGSNPIKAHVGGAVDDGSYAYVFNVDSKNYAYSYQALLYVGNGKYDTESPFVTYNTATATGYSAGSYTTFDTSPRTQFHRGDVLRLTYVANTNNVATGGAYNYFQSYSVSTAGDNVNYHTIANNVSGLFTGKTLSPACETTGSFFVQFEGSYIEIVSYFLAEVDVTYGDVAFYKQAGGGRTTGSATYRYLDNSAQQTVNVSLKYDYHRYASDFASATETEDTAPLGAYYVVAAVQPDTGFFRVTAATNTQEFVVSYFDEAGEALSVNNEEDFTYVDKSYYVMQTVAGKRVVNRTLLTYLERNFVLTADIDVEDFTLTGTYAGYFDGQEHTITTAPGTITTSYGLFDCIFGAVKDLTLMTAMESEIVIDAANTAVVGLLAKEVKGGVIENVSVVARNRVVLRNMASGSVFGGVVGKTTIGANLNVVFADVRVTNEGNALNNVAVSSFVGYATVGTTRFYVVYAFGEIELYNVTDVKAGVLYGAASGTGVLNATGVSYADANVFVNGKTVAGASNEPNAMLSGTYAGDAFDAFVTSDVTVATLTIGEWIKGRLYEDFGYDVSSDDEGLGTAENPLKIYTKAQIEDINGYMNAHFVIASESVDMSGYACTVAVTKVFNGSLAAAEGLAYARLTDFAGNTTTYGKELFGLFGQLNGTVKGLIFDGVEVDFTYTGESALYAGLVAAKAYADASVVNVMMIGSQTVTTTGKAIVGAVVGYAEGATFNDIFDVSNLSVTANEVYLGGVAGQAKNVTLPETAGAVFLLGRTESHGAMSYVGSAFGKLEGTLTGGTRTYTVENNVYVGGTLLQSKPIGGGVTASSIKTVGFDDDGMRTAGFASVGGSAFDVAFRYYPIANGTGSTADPFIVATESDFANINLMLYANYRVTQNITFTNFNTIGEGLVFSGVLKGYVGNDISAENGKIISLTGVTAPLVYYNSGSISELSINVEYSATVASGETFRYGAVAIYSDGEIKNVTVAGTVNITSLAQDTTLYVSGFVAESYGGVVEGDLSKLQNSISALEITVTGGGTAYVGGYAGSVTRGAATFSYGIATGSITVTGVNTTYAGLLVGRSTGECEWVLGEAASIDYTYTITIDGVEIPKKDAEDNPLVENFCGLEFVSD